MSVKIYPSKVFGSINVPTSKSVIHRGLIAAALSDKSGQILKVTLNEDVIATIKALRSLGANIIISDDKVKIESIDLSKKLESVVIDANESGSTMRFIIPIASYISKKVTITGQPRLMQRPMAIYKDIYNNQGLLFNDGLEKIIKGSLKPQYYKVRGNVSSQFISGLMFLLPILNGDSVIEVLAPFESKSYVDLTVAILKKYQINIKEKANKYYIKGNQKYQAYDLLAENDFSQAAFFMVLAVINNDLSINNLNQNSVQGDVAIIDFLKTLGVSIIKTNNTMTISKTYITSATLDLANTPDLGPILCVLGLFSNEYLRLENVKRLRYKESDRLLAMKTELERLGAKIDLKENSMTIYRLEKFKNQEVVVSGHNDHRVVMALAILATTLNKPLIIDGYQAVNKSYPNFFNDLEKLGVRIEFL